VLSSGGLGKSLQTTCRKRQSIMISQETQWKHQKIEKQKDGPARQHVYGVISFLYSLRQEFSRQSSHGDYLQNISEEEVVPQKVFLG
jgi:hypothetical protein